MVAPDPVGELAGRPGGQELSELLARVQQIDPEVLLGTGRRLAAMTAGVDGSLRTLGRRGGDVRAAWQGRGADALTGYLDDFGRAGDRTLETTGRMRARIDAAGRELADLRREVDAHVSRALDAASRARAEALADPARAPMADQVAAQAMTGPTAAARAAVARAETSLGDAATALRDLAAGATGFSRLPVPDTGAIALRPGSGDLGRIAVEPGAAPSPATVPAVADTTADAGGDTGSLDEEAGADAENACDDPDPGGTDKDASVSEASGADGTGNDAATSGDTTSDGDPSSDHHAAGEEKDADGDIRGGGAVTGASTDDGSRGTAAAPAGGPPGQVGDWIREALAVLQSEGVPMDEMDPDDIATIIDHESGGDPDAINDWDSNAEKGTPSQGLMQTIGPTFDAYKLAGHGVITDPVDNIIAGVRYAIDRYGSVSKVPGVEAVARGDAYVGY